MGKISKIRQAALDAGWVVAANPPDANGKRFFTAHKDSYPREVIVRKGYEEPRRFETEDAAWKAVYAQIRKNRIEAEKRRQNRAEEFIKSYDTRDTDPKFETPITPDHWEWDNVDKDEEEDEDE